MPSLNFSTGMDFSVLVVITFLVSSYLVPAEVSGNGTFYNCDVYSSRENIPTQNAYCLKDFRDNIFYCKTWTCQAPPCTPNLQMTQKGDSCPICPGTCTIAGRIVNINETDPCADGSNRCTCIGTGMVMSTRKGTIKYWLCGAPLPGRH